MSPIHLHCMRYLYSALLLTFIIISGCKTGVNNPGEDDPKGFEDLSIPDGFNFETTTETNITVIMPETVDYSRFTGRVDIYSGDPDDTGKRLTSGIIRNDGTANISVTVPTYLQELHIRTFAGSGVIELQQAGLLSGSHTLDLNEEVNFDPPSEEPLDIDTASSQHLTSDNIRKPQSSLQSVQNIIHNGFFEIDDFGLINNWDSPVPSDQRWHITSTLGSNNAHQRSENQLTMMRITPSASRYGGVTQLLPAAAGDLVTLNADVRHTGNPFNTSWLFLIARDNIGEPFAYYSSQFSGSNNRWTKRAIAVDMPEGTASVQVLLWTHIYGGAIDFTNVVVSGPVSDSDGDGVPDEYDEYPDDPLRAFNAWFPAEGVFGTLAYEDLWPQFGDYDMNDLVLDFNLQLVLDASESIKDIIFNLVIRATGAGFQNGFGISFPVPPSQVESVTGTRLTEGIITTLPNGLESGHPDNAVIIAFDNADLNMGSFANVYPEQPFIEPDSLRVTVTFATPAPNDIMDETAPFIFIDTERGREVHLPGNPPTALANPGYFGMDDDDTRPQQNRYYLSKENLNWAFAVPESIPYPLETVEILDAFLRFRDWAESGGEAYPDWYLDIPGYRDESKLYQPPGAEN